MPRTPLNTPADQVLAAEAARRRRANTSHSVEERVHPDGEDVGHAFVEAAADFMQRYESIFAEEFGRERVAR
ncbi:antitoxin [Streptomyces sp. NBC_00101]|uniref:antitoxin n=1 Tax=Streptomyces sp. NBC_00101 TaxID=2975651 RepID=UPI00324DF7C2